MACLKKYLTTIFKDNWTVKCAIILCMSDSKASDSKHCLKVLVEYIHRADMKLKNLNINMIFHISAEHLSIKSHVSYISRPL